jgi:phosphohistidine phosphatase
MDLILWRHAQAEVREPDFERPLTPHGRKQAAKMSAWLDRSLPESCRIFTSPTVRTVQTAEALGRKFKIVDALGPAASPKNIIELSGWPDARVPVMLIGHQPWLGQVASLLLTGTIQDWTIKKSNAWWISNRQREDGNEVYLRAVFAPEFFLD